MKIRPPGLWLSLCSLVWLGAGVLGVWVLARGSYALGTLGVLLGLLTVGLWLGWPWVRRPLIAYWLIVGILSSAAAFTWDNFDSRKAIRTAGFFYFAYLIYQW